MEVGKSTTLKFNTFDKIDSQCQASFLHPVLQFLRKVGHDLGNGLHEVSGSKHRAPLLQKQGACGYDGGHYNIVSTGWLLLSLNVISLKKIRIRTSQCAINRA